MDFSAQLITWYKENKRDLPWRNTSNPYLIWLSEIILQQNRVDQGLGYYSRARNLHASAKIVSQNFNNIFPSTHKGILDLKGVGEYTAAAISSFAYQLPYAVVDGNVYRVLARLFGIHTAIDSNEGKKAFKDLADELLDTNNPDIYNQAIMEFGALQCKPKNPNCEACPFRLKCIAFREETIAVLPFKAKKIKQRNRYFNYLVIENEDLIFLKKRGGNDIWQGLFDFPLIETSKEIEDLEQLAIIDVDKQLSYDNIVLKTVSEEYKHILSHQKIYAKFWRIKLTKTATLKGNYIAVYMDDLYNYPVPKLIDNYLNSTNFSTT